MIMAQATTLSFLVAKPEFYTFEMIGVTQPLVDVAKGVSHSKFLLENGVSTLADEIKKYSGRELESVLADIEEERALLDKLGITLAFQKPGAETENIMNQSDADENIQEN